MEIVTTDFSKFGGRERKMAEELLRAWREQGLPDDFDEDQVSITLNTHSGFVFLSNADFQVAMINRDQLESFYSCPICGHEGFREEMNHNEHNPDCQDYLRDIRAI